MYVSTQKERGCGCNHFNNYTTCNHGLMYRVIFLTRWEICCALFADVSCHVPMHVPEFFENYTNSRIHMENLWNSTRKPAQQPQSYIDTPSSKATFAPGGHSMTRWGNSPIPSPWTSMESEKFTIIIHNHCNGQTKQVDLSLFAHENSWHSCQTSICCSWNKDAKKRTTSSLTRRTWHVSRSIPQSYLVVAGA